MNQPRHPKVILHLDIDYFYAQVEEVMNPDLKEKPFGVKQGLSIVTCNYIARSRGVKKWQPLKESLEKCPELVMVNGEDLSNYKIYSKRMTELLHSLVGPTERMGFDEHYIDVTKLVEERLNKDELTKIFTGPLYPSEETFTECNCGCEQRLMIGSIIAKEIREKILEEIKLTCSVGIAHNKILAKLVGQHNKPNNQTTLAPTAAALFMADLKELRNIFGIGAKTASRIEELGIKTIVDLQNCEISKLLKCFGIEMASRLKEMSIGVDMNEVKPSGKSKTVGLEDSCRPFSNRNDASEMFQSLLPRLVHQIKDDMRLPLALRVTVRQFDITKKVSYKQTKQINLVPSLFKFVDEELQLTPGADEKIVKDVMSAFDHVVGVKQKFFVNLLGLCFCKLQEQKSGATGAITNFLTPKLNESFEATEQANSSTEEEKLFEPSSKRQKLEDDSRSSSSLPEIPSNIDPSVWKELPIDVQRELLSSWKPSTNKRKAPNTLLNHFVKKQNSR